MRDQLQRDAERPFGALHALPAVVLAYALLALLLLGCSEPPTPEPVQSLPAPCERVDLDGRCVPPLAVPS